MLKVPTRDICIESPNQNEFVNIVSNKKENDHILGRGSYGRVYKAIYRDQLVAVKIIKRTNKDTANSVSGESNILSWDHENIIKIFKITSLDDCFTIIMERFPGICLQQLLNRITIPLWHRLRISKDIISGLNFCHARNLVHLDVKPSNVFVVFCSDLSNISINNYICKLFDFGCSTFLNASSCRPNQCGTIRYMSPESLQGSTVNLHDDIYSFGITMWQLKTGNDPYYNIKSNDFVAYHVVKNNLRPDSQFNCFENDENVNYHHVNSKRMNTKTVNSKAVDSTQSSAMGSSIIKSFNYLNPIKEPYILLTPNIKRKRLETNFLSTGHSKKQSKLTPMSVNVAKKIDFSLVCSNKSRSPLLENQDINLTKICNPSNALNKNKVFSVFKDTHANLMEERKIEIENEYACIYKQCWDREASKRPSSQVVLDLLKSIYNLFD